MRGCDTTYKKLVQLEVLAELALLLAGLTVLFLGSVDSATAQAPAEQRGLAGCWTLYSSPNRIFPDRSPQALSGAFLEYLRLKGVAIGSDRDVWALAEQRENGHPVLLRFDGERWSFLYGTGPEDSTLNKIAALSADDVWAVGSYTQGTRRETLVLHWDGAGWSMVSSPGPGPEYNSLEAISAISPNDIWAVGVYSEESRTPQGRYSGTLLALHWDGASWSRVPGISLEDAGYICCTPTISGVAALADNDVWVVSGLKVLHWDGSQWSVSLQSPSLNLNTPLTAITADRPDSVWAVSGGFDKTDGPAMFHWDGRGWQAVRFREGIRAQLLSDIAAVGPDDVWAVGEYIGLGTGLDLPTVIHWDGSTWEEAPVPVDALGASPAAVAARNGDLWVVGQYAPRSLEEELGMMLHHTCAQPLVRPLNSPAPVPGSGSALFAEKGKVVGGIFLDYLRGHGGQHYPVYPEEHGGLGYPLSDVIGEVSDDGNWLRTVQYFEREELEYHPENEPPYNVLLSQLGTLRYKQKYPGGAPGQQPNNTTGSVLFSQTGRRLGGYFYNYWLSHDGLAELGYPISDEFNERSDFDGLPYTVQYFERAVLELHPENGSQDSIWQLPLGEMRYDSKYGVGVSGR